MLQLFFLFTFSRKVKWRLWLPMTSVDCWKSIAHERKQNHNNILLPIVDIIREQQNRKYAKWLIGGDVSLKWSQMAFNWPAYHFYCLFCCLFVGCVFIHLLLFHIHLHSLHNLVCKAYNIEPARVCATHINFFKPSSQWCEQFRKYRHCLSQTLSNRAFIAYLQNL